MKVIGILLLVAAALCASVGTFQETELAPLFSIKRTELRAAEERVRAKEDWMKAVQAIQSSDPGQIVFVRDREARDMAREAIAREVRLTRAQVGDIEQRLLEAKIQLATIQQDVTEQRRWLWGAVAGLFSLGLILLAIPSSAQPKIIYVSAPPPIPPPPS